MTNFVCGEKIYNHSEKVNIQYSKAKGKTRVYRGVFRTLPNI